METTKVVNGNLEIIKTNDSTITTMTEEEVVGKIAETQTKIDHLNIDIAEAEAEKVKWNGYLTQLKG